MKANNHIAEAITKFGAAILLGGAVALSTVACSTKSNPAVSVNSTPITSSVPVSERADVRPVALQNVEPAQMAGKRVASRVAKPSAALPVVYKSRDYGVSFVYPWQYSLVSARMVATGDESLRPKPDGHEGQFTLARVDIPKGFYADTNYESGYFILSLNQEVNQQECESWLGRTARWRARPSTGWSSAG